MALTTSSLQTNLSSSLLFAWRAIGFSLETRRYRILFDSIVTQTMPKDIKSGDYTSLHSDVELDALESPPEFADEIKKPVSQRPRRRAVRVADLRDGWRFGASLGAGTCIFVLVLNISLIAWGSFRSKANKGHIFSGSCKEAKRYNMVIHLAINFLSTLLLGASNYCLQCLCAPTRKNIDRAHQEGRWLDVGVQSFRNLRTAGLLKRHAWMVLGFSSLPLHLLYNSVFYSTQVNYDYDLYFASEGWLKGDWYNSTSFSAGGTTADLWYPFTKEYKQQTIAGYTSDPNAILSAYQQDPTNFDRMDLASCVDTYATSYMSHYSNLILVSDDSPLDESPFRYYYYNDPSIPSSLHWVIFSHDTNEDLWSNYDRYGWMCDHWQMTSPSCTNAKAQKRVATGKFSVYGYNVTQCLGQKVEELCSINFSLPIGIVVILANLSKAICILGVCFFLSDQPLITIGDAINSFLRFPDQSTKHLCLRTPGEVKKLWAESQRANIPTHAKAYQVQVMRRWNTVARSNWYLFMALFGTALLIILFLLIYSLNKLRDSSFTALRELGFGTASSTNVISGAGWVLPTIGTRAVVANALVANSPQLLLSFIYLVLNDLLTRIQTAVEWTSYSVDRKALRVSHDRKGAQRATYFLQLPYRYGLPLMVISATLHWLVSQSIFLVTIDTFDSDGTLSAQESIATCGYSPLAIICTLVCGALVIVYVVAVGVRPLRNGGMPLVGCSSVGIAAACHAPKEGNHEQEPLMWGAVSEGLLEERVTAYGEDEVGHCSFSSSAVDCLVAGRLYS